MLRILRKLLTVPRLVHREDNNPDGTARETWTADFSKRKQVRFDIKSESAYDANLLKLGARHCLSLGLKKRNCIAWTEAPGKKYGDVSIRARVSIDSRGGYAAAGMMFRMLDEKTYYSFLVSSKGYFRLDVVRNGMPLPLAGWIELPGSASREGRVSDSVDFTIIAYGNHIVILIDDEWAAEVTDSTVMAGALCFSAASYGAETEAAPDSGDPGAAAEAPGLPWPAGSDSAYTAEAFLESLVVESRFDKVAEVYEARRDGSGYPVNPLNRIRLAETFAATGGYQAALAQFRKAFESPGSAKTQRALLLAGRLAGLLGFTEDAEAWIGECFQMSVDTPEGKEAVTEMAKILYTAGRFTELKQFCVEAFKLRPLDPVLLAFKGHAHWDLNEYREAAAAYDAAFEQDQGNGLLAKNAANAYEALGKKKEALKRYLAAGRAFLAAENYNDLGLLIPGLLAGGDAGSEAHGLAGKWAFGVEDWDMARRELAAARALEKKKRSGRDPALAYLEALLLVAEGKRGKALPLFEEAASLKPDYALFRFKLAENLFLLKNDPEDPAMRSELEAALALAPEDGWIHNFAGQLSMEQGDLAAAGEHLRKAFKSAGEHPAIRMNRAALLARQGSVDEALRLLAAEENDADGALGNCAARILLEAGRFEEADDYFRKALARDPENPDYLFNRASCLIQMERYGEADTLLAKVHDRAPSPAVLEALSYVASRKGEYARAESASRAALEMEPGHIPSLLSLGWTLVNLGRLDEAEEITARLGNLALSKTAQSRVKDLALHIENLRYMTISCSCGRTWRALKEQPPVSWKRLYAMPPDDLPAGSCPVCGKTWCIGCARHNLDESGRFLCVECGKPLRLTSEGLKKLISDWAARDGLSQTAEDSAKRKRGRPRKNPG